LTDGRSTLDLFGRYSQWEKVAYGAFSDISVASAPYAGRPKKRGFCRLRNATIGVSQVRQPASTSANKFSRMLNHD
jgi:hypothetical protein